MRYLSLMCLVVVVLGFGFCGFTEAQSVDVQLHQHRDKDVKSVSDTLADVREEESLQQRALLLEESKQDYLTLSETRFLDRLPSLAFTIADPPVTTKAAPEAAGAAPAGHGD